MKNIVMNVINNRVYNPLFLEMCAKFVFSIWITDVISLENWRNPAFMYPQPFRLRFTHAVISLQITSAILQLVLGYSVLCDGRPLCSRRERIGVSSHTRGSICVYMYETVETSRIFRIRVTSQNITVTLVDSVLQARRLSLEIIEI